MHGNPEPMTAKVDLLTGLSAVLSGEAALARAQEAAVGLVSRTRARVHYTGFWQCGIEVAVFPTVSRLQVLKALST